MGKYKTIIGSAISGNVGSMNFRRRGSTTVVAVRSYANSSKGDGATDIQRRHRSRMANVVSFFRAIKPTQPNAWQYGNAGATPYNRFFSANLASSPIFLTNEESRLRSCVIASYSVSSGSLMPLAQNCVDGIFHSGVVVSAGLDLETCTLGEFSASVIANSNDWLDGDKLYMCFLDQRMKRIGGHDFPAVLTKFFSVALDTTSSRPFAALANYSALGLAISEDGELICSTVHDAAFGIHSRIVAGELLASPQQVVVRSFEEPIYLRYSSSEQEERAMRSYGYQEPVLLTPYSDHIKTPHVVAIINYILLNGEPLTEGFVLEEDGTLVINGSNLGQGRVRVEIDSQPLTPTTETESELSFEIVEDGVYHIIVNELQFVSFSKTSPLVSIIQCIDYNSWSELSQDGITITPLEDGSITVSGVALNAIDYILSRNYTTIIGHIYMLWLKNQVQGLFAYNRNRSTLSTEILNPAIGQINYASSARLYVGKNVSFNNIIVTPQLIDLTETFGSGNEPATPQEFAERLGYASPEDLPYFPYNPGVAAASARRIPMGDADPLDFVEQTPDFPSEIE